MTTFLPCRPDPHHARRVRRRFEQPHGLRALCFKPLQKILIDRYSPHHLFFR